MDILFSVVCGIEKIVFKGHFIIIFLYQSLKSKEAKKNSTVFMYFSRSCYFSTVLAAL